MVWKGSTKLRIMTRNDANALYNIVQESPELWAYMPKKIENENDMQEMVEEAIKNYKRGYVLPFVVINQFTCDIVDSTVPVSMIFLWIIKHWS